MHNTTATKAIQSEEKLNLLIVDDEQAILDSLSFDLRRLFSVFTATGLIQAKVILKQHQIDIALVDERLPDGNGSDLLAELRNEYPDIVRILFSGFTDTTAILNSINKANVFKFIVKPWGSELKTILEEAIAHYRLKKQNQFRDTFTSLKSESVIFESLHSEMKRCHRKKAPLTVILLKIANPKKNSELHSFLVDRFLLKKISEILLSELRESDIAGRLKNNQLLILLTDADENGANVFLLRLLSKIDKFDKETNKGLLPFQIEHSMITYKGEEVLGNDQLFDILESKLKQNHK